ncbi:hypothetical protein DY000_02033796 [Brassica cretica]|uniref:Uncharacterized protein n=1 Tax=Brassica cretica TaxID=69181 RepID=A0ABQ7DUC1_BRACR|nr:hypothetical protein DY000_02033796 [Brassica cretica]
MGTETDGSNLFSETSSPLEMSEQSEQNEKANVEPSKVLKHTLKADQTRPSRLSISTSSSKALTGLTEAARLGTSQAELKDGTTRAPIVRFLSCQRAMELKPS